ncbi:hypothetical protein TI05_18090, partial [Achromatium sp. WMS3]
MNRINLSLKYAFLLLITLFIATTSHGSKQINQPKKMHDTSIFHEEYSICEDILIKDLNENQKDIMVYFITSIILAHKISTLKRTDKNLLYPNALKEYKEEKKTFNCKNLNFNHNLHDIL